MLNLLAKNIPGVTKMCTLIKAHHTDLLQIPRNWLQMHEVAEPSSSAFTTQVTDMLKRKKQSKMSIFLHAHLFGWARSTTSPLFIASFSFTLEREGGIKPGKFAVNPQNIKTNSSSSLILVVIFA